MDKGTYSISYTGVAHRYASRPNEDSYISFSVGCYDVLAVFDGISSHFGGNTASKICAETISISLQRDLTIDVVDVKEAIINAVKEAQQLILTRQLEEPALFKMGCTATIVCIDKNNRNVYIYSIGDSAVFRIRKGQISKLTIDSTLCGEALDLGSMSRKEALGYPDGFSLRQWMGMPDMDIPEGRFSVWHLHPGDEYIVSTDGLHGYLSQKKILKIVGRGVSGKEVVECLYDAALHGKNIKGRKNKDDCTICYYHFPGKNETNMWKVMQNIMLIFVLIGLSFFAGMITGKKMGNNVIDLMQSASVNIEAENHISDSTNVETQNKEHHEITNNF